MSQILGEAEGGRPVQLSDITQAKNLVALFLVRADKLGDRSMLQAVTGRSWASISWQEAARRVCLAAENLRALGLQPGDRVVLVSENRPEWCLADLAIMAAGCITTPAYTTNTPADHAHILNDSGAAAVIVANDALAKPLFAALSGNHQIRHIIAFDSITEPAPDGMTIMAWDSLLTGDADRARESVHRRMADIGRGDQACLIYTSGTGAAPRGVCQHHGAILHNIYGTAQIIAEDFGWDHEVFLSFLPLSHAYEHTVGQFLPIALGGTIAYAQSLDRLVTNLGEVRPTIMIVVPRLFKLLRKRIRMQVQAKGRFAAWLLDHAVDLAARRAAGRRKRVTDLIISKAAQCFLQPKLKAGFGGRIKAMVSGGAALNPELGHFFEAIGITLLQGYGQTEAGPVISCNRPGIGNRCETVGPPLADTEVDIGEDGEILVKGELVMHRYWNMPDETARVLVNGWLHTGDIGRLDSGGRIVITDRKKDMIINDKGDNISPQKVEGLLLMQPEISQAMICGNGRPYPVALIVPDAEWALSWAQDNDEPFDMAVLQALPSFIASIRKAVDRVNRDLSVIEKVRRFTFADEPFSTTNGEMTASLKTRRFRVYERYADRLDALYRK